VTTLFIYDVFIIIKDNSYSRISTMIQSGAEADQQHSSQNCACAQLSRGLGASTLLTGILF